MSEIRSIPSEAAAVAQQLNAQASSAQPKRYTSVSDLSDGAPAAQHDQVSSALPDAQTTLATTLNVSAEGLRHVSDAFTQADMGIADQIIRGVQILTDNAIGLVNQVPHQP